MRLGVGVMLSVVVGGAAGLAAAQELRDVCDGSRGRALGAEEAQARAEQRFDLARGTADGLAGEQFVAALPAADDLRRRFGQVDQDGDGRISREEWMRSFGPIHAGTIEGVGSRSVGLD